MKLKHEELNKFIADIETKGYIEYPGQTYNNSDRIWWKNIDGHKNGTIVGAALYDFSKFSRIEDFYSTYPYSVMYCCIFEENEDIPRMDVTASGCENYSIEQFEEYIKRIKEITH